MLNALFRNNGWVISAGKGLGSVLFPCPPADVFLRTQQATNGISWSGCGNYGYSDTSIANYNYYTDGNCGEYSTFGGTWNRPDGDVLYSTDCCSVIYSNGSYYVNDNCNPCGEANTLTGNTRYANESFLYWEGCNSSGNFRTSATIESEYNDGYCGTYWEQTGTFTAEDNSQIYNRDGCCYVYYRQYYNSYEVYDNCGCPSSGTFLRSEGGSNTFDWSGCGNSGSFAYSSWNTNYYADGNCGEYATGDSSEQPSGTVIYDGGCCQVVYNGSGSYSVNDNCGGGYPPAGTVLNSSSSPLTQSIYYSGNDMDGYYLDNQYASFDIGNSWSEEIADGMGGSYFTGGSNYISDGTTVFTPSIGSVRLLDWYVNDGGGSYSGQLQVGLDVTPWVMSGSGAVQSGTSFLDKFSSGYIIFESNEYWNGDANVKTRVEYQSGGGYITTTITF